jgi:hypothetical protein
MIQTRQPSKDCENDIEPERSPNPNTKEDCKWRQEKSYDKKHNGDKGTHCKMLEQGNVGERVILI